MILAWQNCQVPRATSTDIKIFTLYTRRINHIPVALRLVSSSGRVPNHGRLRTTFPET
jgi:hypothetical protein